MNPRVSVIMGVYNSARYVEEAIGSILNQKFRDFEFIILDDGSSDGSQDILRRMAKKDVRIRLIFTRQRLGLPKSLNRLLREAKGEFIAHMDADDWSHPERLDKEVSFLDKHPDIDIVGTNAHVINNEGEVTGELVYPGKHKDLYNLMIRFPPVVNPSSMFRKSVVDKIGYYNPRFLNAQDYDYYMRTLSAGMGATIQSKLFKYRVDFSQNTGFNCGKDQERCALIIRWQGLTKFGWPWWHGIFLVKPALSFLIPMWVKKPLIRLIKKW